ncbi:Transducin [Spironucleus salmonicida]|uniref:Transducin n=1 Tax=Spironucleus salmonicida TaxID=348837 RepID=V6LPM9_9EUKA|nr:Transducin [Spironucleus salmonicida]|eukprot:EST46575.1 Transducin [Spironucleus salmonicida]
MDTNTLFLHPDAIISRSIAYHPYLDILATGGVSQDEGAIVFLHSKSCLKQPYVHACVQHFNNQLQLPQQDSRIPSAPELAIPMNSVLSISFSPCGRFLAVLGSDLTSEKIFIYTFTPNDINHKKLKIFRKFDFPHQFSEIIWSPDSSYIAAGTHDGYLLLIPVRTKIANYNIDYDQIRTCNKQFTIKASNSSILGISWSRCGFLLAIQSYNEVQILICKQNKNSISIRKGQKISYIREDFIGEGIQFKEELTNFKTGLNIPKYLLNGSYQNVNFTSLFLNRGAEKFQIEQQSLRTVYAIALYRRQCDWSPDTSFLVLPCGQLPVKSTEKDFISQTFCSYVYTKTATHTGAQDPSIVLPGLRFPSTTIKFSPVLYQLNNEKQNITDLPYRMIFAVASGCDVTIYDTQTFTPIALFQGESFQSDYITSLSWDFTGQQLCAFGAHFQFQFLNFSLPIYGVDLSIQAAKLAQDSEIARLKQDYCVRYLGYRKKLQQYSNGELDKKPNAPTKPKIPPIFVSQSGYQQKCKIYAVSDYFQSDIQSQPLLHFEVGELEWLLDQINGETQIFKGSEQGAQEVDEKVGENVKE